MGKIIQGEFERRKKQAEAEWEEAVKEMERRATRSINIIIGGFCLAIVFIASIPFVVDYLVGGN